MARGAPALLLCAAAAVGLALASGSPGRADEDDGGPVLDKYERKIVVLDPFPAGTSYPARVPLGGRLVGGYRFPQVSVIRPNGRADYVPAADVRVSGARFTATLALDGGRGVYRIELTAVSPANATHTAARLRLFAGVPVVRGDEALPPDEGDDAAVPTVLLERRVADRIDALRKAAGVDPLPGLEPVAAAARAHAAACVARGTVDHRVDSAGDLAARLAALYRWQGVAYLLPVGPPAPGPTATTYVSAIVESVKSVDHLAARWKRNAAYLVPLLDAHLTHVAVGIAPAKGSFVVVVALVQMGRDDVVKDVETRWTTLFDDYKAATAVAPRVSRLREMALWGRKESKREAAKHADAADPDLRAAAWDARAVLDEADARRDGADLVRRMEADAKEGRPASALASTVWMTRCAWAPFLAVPAAALRERLEAAAKTALDAADALAKDSKAAAAKAAYEALAATYPGTAAAEESKKRRR